MSTVVGNILWLMTQPRGKKKKEKKKLPWIKLYYLQYSLTWTFEVTSCDCVHIFVISLIIIIYLPLLVRTGLGNTALRYIGVGGDSHITSQGSYDIGKVRLTYT